MNATVVIKKLTGFASTSSIALKKIWDPLWRILTFSPADETIFPSKKVSVSIETGSISIAYGSRFLSRIKIKGLREYSFEEGKYPQPDVLASSLAFAMNELGAMKADVSLSIPKAWAVIKTAEFPAAVKENLSAAISYELDRITPFSSENAFYDYTIINENEEKITIMIVAAKEVLIRPYIDALKEKGIKLTKVTVNLLGIKTLCRYSDRKTNPVFVEIHKNGYGGALFINNTITDAFAESFNTPPVPLSIKGGEGRVEESKIDKIMKTIAPLIDTVKNSKKSPQLVVLFRDKNSTLRELLKTQTNIPVRILNESDLRLRFPGQLKEISYAAVGGALDSLWPKADGLNLLKKGYHEKLKTPKALTILLLLIVVALWILYIIAPLKVEEKRLEVIDQQIALRKDEVRKIEALKKERETLNNEISTIYKFKESRPMALNILKELTSILPKNAWLSRIRISESAVNLEGYAASATGILSKLEASPQFKKVEFASPTFRDKRMNAERFNIKMEIEGIQELIIKPRVVEDEEDEEEE